MKINTSKEMIKAAVERVGIEYSDEMKIYLLHGQYAVVEGGHGHYNSATNSGGDKFICWL